MCTNECPMANESLSAVVVVCLIPSDISRVRLKSSPTSVNKQIQPKFDDSQTATAKESTRERSTRTQATARLTQQQQQTCRSHPGHAPRRRRRLQGPSPPRVSTTNSSSSVNTDSETSEKSGGRFDMWWYADGTDRLCVLMVARLNYACAGFCYSIQLELHWA
jgi:hypothetical protein